MNPYGTPVRKFKNGKLPQNIWITYILPHFVEPKEWLVLEGVCKFLYKLLNPECKNCDHKALELSSECVDPWATAYENLGYPIFGQNKLYDDISCRPMKSLLRRSMFIENVS